MISVIIPIFNEASTLPVLRQRLSDALAPLHEAFEVILIDDGSSDSSFVLMQEINREDARFKVIRLSRNFGHQIAISAGMDLASGDVALLMDGDLQDPPELIPRMLAAWREGHQVVYTVKRTRKEHPLKRFAFNAFYRVMHSVSEIDIPVGAGNFSLIDRAVLDVLRSMPERNRYVSGMRAWAGFRQTAIWYDREARYAGEPQMSFGRLVRLALNGIFSFSDVPLRLAIYLGVSAAVLSFCGGLYVLYEKLFTDKAILGWASTIISILFVGGLILLTLGVIGEYISRIYEEVKHRPLYVIREKIGF